MSNAIVFLDLPEEAVLQARIELRRAFISDGSAQWMKDLAVDAALERIFNIFRSTTALNDRDLCGCKIGQCRALTERCRETETVR